MGLDPLSFSQKKKDDESSLVPKALLDKYENP
jgi:hypothetical protein